MKFRANNDIFGLWDMVIIMEGRLVMVQVKSNPSHFYAARKAIAELNPTYPYELVLYQGKRKPIRFWNAKEKDRFKSIRMDIKDTGDLNV